MGMEEKQKPNFHDHLIGKDTPLSWSDLPQDLLNSIFERLTFANFQRAKAVCSSWLASSRQCVPKKQNHWLILFPEDNENNYQCTLFNPEERDKLHRTKDLGLEFAKSFCIATYGSWLLMQYPRCSLYVLNLFTHERINLPSVESQLGTAKVERTLDGDGNVEFRTTGPDGKVYRGTSIRNPVFWIDERTNDYVVVWGLRDLCVVYSKKGDTAWTQLPKTSGCVDVVYKESKLYFLSLSGCFFIFDLSGETPQQIFQCGVIVERLRLGLVVPTKLVVTVTGEVFKAEKWWRSRSKTWTFRVIKICSPGFLRNHQLVGSLGDESMLLEQGVTVLSNEGFIRDCIYFSDIRENTYSIFLFNLKTKKTEPLHNFDRSLAQFSRARWFLPQT
ncbi:putative F-box protein [Raphanus sativus]|uniref:F-box protein At4g22170 n=1 Tax=Raphanus sativus TaxID=3726 RepID=A0A9W3D993_RAPSA|nr:putative F-box protein At4g22170 [Raphanus sativus]KAJ4912874.1 putative F-box protein [Raphanus sativus]